MFILLARLLNRVKSIFVLTCKIFNPVVVYYIAGTNQKLETSTLSSNPNRILTTTSSSSSFSLMLLILGNFFDVENRGGALALECLPHVDVTVFEFF